MTEQVPRHVAWETARSYAQLILTTSTLINGAAAITLMTFLGTSPPCAATGSRPGSAMLFFGLGVLLSATSALLAFFAHTDLYWDSIKNEPQSSYGTWNRAAVWVGFFSIVAFVFGLIFGYFWLDRCLQSPVAPTLYP